MVYLKVKVNEHGQIVIPKAFRDAYDIQPGTELFMGEKNNEIVLEKKFTRKEFAAALDAFPKWGKVTVDSDKDYEEELESR